jgi:tRNA dimethylallyltransferase
MSNNQKIIVILGPTSSGKSDVAILLAKKFDGEIISADSRQVYRGMDIGTGKIINDFSVPKSKVESRKSKVELNDPKFSVYWSEGIAHYGIDIVSPNTDYNVSKFKKYADKIIIDILKRGKIPIICGGTGFWIKALVDNIVYPEVKPNWNLREKLEKKSAEELFKILQKLDPQRAKNIDAKNPVRLIRAIEICKTLGKVPHPPTPSPESGRGWIEQKQNPGEGKNNYKFLQIGISTRREKLAERIKLRLQKRFKAGMVKEVEKLHFEDKISWKRLESFGLGYNLIPKYLKGEIKSKEELFEKVYIAEKNYAKRQMTWFNKDKRIVWLDDYKKIKKRISIFLKS